MSVSQLPSPCRSYCFSDAGARALGAFLALLNLRTDLFKHNHRNFLSSGFLLPFPLLSSFLAPSPQDDEGN